MSSEFNLGINTGFAINRFPEPKVWLRIVGKELGLKYVQFVIDLLNSFLPKIVIDREVEKIKKNAEGTGLFFCEKQR